MGYTSIMEDSGFIAYVVTTSVSYDNVLAKAVNNLYKSEMVDHLKKEWLSVIDIELATLELLNWFNKIRLHSSIRYVSSFGFKKRYYNRLILLGIAACLK